MSYSVKTPTFCVFLYLAWRLWKSVVTLAVTGNTISGRVFGVTGDGVSEASTAVDQKSTGHTFGELYGYDANFLCISCI
jgi:hypothetical protein